MARQRGSRSTHNTKQRPGSRPGSAIRRWLGRWARRALVFGGTLALIGAIAVFAAVYFAARELPSFAALKSSQQGQMILVRARNGAPIVELGPSYGEWLEAQEIPAVMKEAMIAVEDHRFASHFGIDPVGLARALYTSVALDRRVSATSTITQQLARNIFLNSDRTMDRKLREAILAMALEWNFSKEQILELYLNKMYFGGGAYGIDAASRKFFSHPANELSLEEAAIVAGLVKAPSRYSPTADPEAAVARAKVVLEQMVRYGDLDPARLAPIDVAALRLQEEGGQNSARYFTDWALPQLDLLLPGKTFEPIEVWTTLDPDLQRAASAALVSHVPRGSQGALVSLDRDGAVLAMVGGTNYVASSFNRATEAMRQPGSAWKLFVYLAALEAGYRPDDTVNDAPITIDGWSPRNASGAYAGLIDLRSAFAYSVNTVAAALGHEVGFGTIASMARRFGITTPIATNPAMVLGVADVRIIDLTRAFAAVQARGRAVEPYGIVRVTTTDGKELYRRSPPRETMLVPEHVAAGITDLLQTAVATGTGRAAQIGRPVAGKTGTTSSSRDGWFVGFSSGITTGVWMGRDDARAVPGLQGGAAPARAFAAFMAKAVQQRPPEPFDTELRLPEWMLAPEEEYSFDPFAEGDPGAAGFGEGLAPPSPERFVPLGPDRLAPAEPGAPGERARPRNPLDPAGMPSPAPARRAPGPPPLPPAANEEFLDRAIGRTSPSPTR